MDRDGNTLVRKISLLCLFLLFLAFGFAISLYWVDPAFASSAALQCGGVLDPSQIDNGPQSQDDIISKLIAVLRYFIQLFINIYCAFVKALGFHCG